MIKQYEVEFCYKDPYSEIYVTKRVNTVKSDVIPRIGETIEYHETWEVFDVIHRYIEKTNHMNTIVRVK